MTYSATMLAGNATAARQQQHGTGGGRERGEAKWTGGSGGARMSARGLGRPRIYKSSHSLPELLALYSNSLTKPPSLTFRSPQACRSLSAIPTAWPTANPYLKPGLPTEVRRCSGRRRPSLPCRRCDSWCSGGFRDSLLQSVLIAPRSLIWTALKGRSQVFRDAGSSARAFPLAAD